MLNSNERYPDHHCSAQAVPPTVGRCSLDGPGAFGVAAKDLLQAAESWRAAVMESALAAGHEDRPRPPFRQPACAAQSPCRFPQVSP